MNLPYMAKLLHLAPLTSICAIGSRMDVALANLVRS
jgi:hypothetical protein